MGQTFGCFKGNLILFLVCIEHVSYYITHQSKSDQSYTQPLVNTISDVLPPIEYIVPTLINRPVVAGAVLQSPLLLIH